MKEKKVICLKYVSREKYLKRAHGRFPLLGLGTFKTLWACQAYLEAQLGYSAHFCSKRCQGETDKNIEKRLSDIAKSNYAVELFSVMFETEKDWDLHHRRFYRACRIAHPHTIDYEESMFYFK